jgi:phosphatidyl-myo-inositol dimannoside synthase
VKILALMPDSYSGFGGIAQYNRDLLDALSGMHGVQEVLTLPRLAAPNSRPGPSKVTERPVPGNPIRYVAEALKLYLTSRPNLILCGHINLLLVAVLLKKISGRPIVLEAYGIEAWEYGGTARLWALGQVDLIITISRYTRARLMAWSGLAPDAVKVLPNAIRLEHYLPANKPGYLIERYGLAGKRVLLSLGRLDARERYKGHDRIIPLLPRLATKFPDLIYLIVGDGDDRPRLEELVRKVGVEERVVFAGRVPEGEKVDHYNLADAFAMPSSGEGFGFVFLEAAACGVPVLGGGNDGGRDALADGRVGVMVDPGVVSELAVGLEQVLLKGRSVPRQLEAFSFASFKERLEFLINNAGCGTRRVRGAE